MERRYHRYERVRRGQRVWDVDRQRKQWIMILEMDLLGLTAKQIGNKLGESRQFVEYYLKKGEDPDFHSEPVGGGKGRARFSDDEIVVGQLFVVDMFAANVDLRYAYFHFPLYY